jgi:ribosomal protein S18 acetylase RimI-like enzyme
MERVEGAAIREARPEDAAAAIALWTEAYVTHGVGGRTEPYSVEDFHESRQNGAVLVVDRDAGLAGVVALSPPGAAANVVAAPAEAELSRLAVAIPARRRGIGRALTAHCEQRARAAGWPAIALWSRPGQVEAHRLYESLGYRRVPKRDSIDASGQGRLVFRLELQRGSGGG